MLNRTRIKGLLKKENIRGLAVLVIVLAIPTLAILGFAGVFDPKDDVPMMPPTLDPGPFLPNEPEPYYYNCSAAERDKARASRFTIISPISGDRGLPTRLLRTQDGDGDGVICELIWKR